MKLLETRVYYFNVGGKLPLGIPLVYTDPIPTEGADEIGLFVYTNPAVSGGTNVNAYIRVAFAGALPGSGEPTVFAEETIQLAGTQTGAKPNVQIMTVFLKDYGPFPTDQSLGTSPTRGTIWIPNAAHFFKVGCYTDVNPSSMAAVTVIVERAVMNGAF